MTLDEDGEQAFENENFDGDVKTKETMADRREDNTEVDILNDAPSVRLKFFPSRILLANLSFRYLSCNFSYHCNIV